MAQQDPGQMTPGQFLCAVRDHDDAPIHPASEIMQPWAPVDTVSINAEREPATSLAVPVKFGAMPPVISRDPSLALLAAGHRRLAAMQQSSFPGADSPECVSFRKVLAQGAPIDILGSQLVSITTAPIPSMRFRIPAEPVAAALVHANRAAVRAATTLAAATPEDRQHEKDRFIERAI